MKPTIYIDGQAGTTGLQIYQRLGQRTDIELLSIDPDRRKDPEERKKLLNAADLVFLCLPDAAAKEAVALVENPAVRIIDASTAHRTNPDWTYGFPELSPERNAATTGTKRLANPAATPPGFISSVAPLVQHGVLSPDDFIPCYSLTGYSGGGKGMIADYEADARETALDAPAIYGLTLNHKHVPEMQAVCGLTTAPCFTPVVDDYYKGMATTIMLHTSQLKGVTSLHQVWEAYAAHYAGQQMVKVAPEGAAKLYAGVKAGDNDLTIVVAGNDASFTVTALFDNLGKGASGAAVQNMNIMLGLEETTSLL